MNLFSLRSARRSLGVVVVLWLVIVAWFLRSPPGNAFAWDVFGYHLYLPAFFERHDPFIKDLAWVDAARVKYEASGTLYQVTTLPDGQHVIKYPIGLAVLWSPWYALGHVVAAGTGQPTDGYSPAYEWCISGGVMLYLLLGLLALRAALLRRFSDTITAWTIVLATIGTNYVEQAVNGPTMPHAILFSLYAGTCCSPCAGMSIVGCATPWCSAC